MWMSVIHVSVYGPEPRGHLRAKAKVTKGKVAVQGGHTKGGHTKRVREQVRAKETGIKCGKTNLLRRPHRIAPTTLVNPFVKGLTMGDAPPKVNGTAPNVSNMYVT